MKLHACPLLCVCITVAFVGVASAQDAPTNGQLAIDDLRAPTSPAFVLLDITPASVERPVSPKALTLNLITAASQPSGLPQNYAIEVAPYWLASHPGLTFDEYQRPALGASIVRTFSVSVATTPIASGSESASGTRLGIGVRTNLVGGQPNPNLKALVDGLESVNIEILRRLEANDKADISDLRTKARALALQIQGMDAERVGFVMAAAAGHVWAFPGDSFAGRQRGRWGAWLTPVYRFRACGEADSECQTLVDVIGVLRALRDPEQHTQWDIGGRLLWQPNKELAVSAEFLRRSGMSSGAGDQRTVGIVEYRVRDDLLLFGSFGQDFDDGDRRTLVSLLGLNIGFGRKASVTPR